VPLNALVRDLKISFVSKKWHTQTRNLPVASGRGIKKIIIKQTESSDSLAYKFSDQGDDILHICRGLPGYGPIGTKPGELALGESTGIPF